MQNVFDNAKIDARLSKSHQLYEHLRAAIISMKLVPGEPLPEKELCAHFGVSKTPFRDALKKLVDESLVTVVPSGGTFVNKMVLREVLEGQMVRETLEVKMVRLAARNYHPSFDKKFELQLFTQELAARNPNVDEFFALDNEFHRLICLCAGFPKIWQTIHYATGQLDRVRRHSYTMRSHFDDVLKEHREIHDAIKRGDEAGAAKAFQIQLDAVIPVFEQLRLEASDIIDDCAGIGVEQIR
ncbi:GntR family transcriptional regulator [Agrobacterium leguminum]|uniref:GntR family transcriptional regulator n=1 Tax=Rhizobiaceae TaxID=82115 RepID=UPI00148F4FF3|nr:MULTISPECIES: GntR family transcriptional regulator [Rhizobiaceae]MCZ7934783.1 GntR family transcriptional regulator [Agrobacterium leguminum]MCZ7977258.1 GntR family transcriptional regulator [Agrobacterium salinitolerans]NOV19266.1 GntR family transcriptional regulator [Ensifer canadensis]NSX94463.1 GntR family transcriptional regulator [Agrobacterium tumefaciens]NTA40616.1 GntR family transcriptional regulator [Agrobacterium salinitolerans]